MTCPVCVGTKRILLPLHGEITSVLASPVTEPLSSTVSAEEFPCPKCQMVPFKQVRAMKVCARYAVEEYGRVQVPIERSLAARFGEYLMREGLITFTQDNIDDKDFRKTTVNVTAHLGVVDKASTLKANATAEVAFTKAPKLSPSLTDRQRRAARVNVRLDAVPWKLPDEETTAEFQQDPDEIMGAVESRFGGLDI